MLLTVVRVIYEYNEVNSEIELEFFGLEIFF